MLGIVSRAVDRFRGGGEASVTIPSMDGALRPNVRIDNAPLVHSVAEPDNLARWRDCVVFSSGQDLMAVNEGAAPTLVEALPTAITCLASDPSGGLAIGLADGSVILRGGTHEGKRLREVANRRIVAPTAVAFDGPDTLLLSLGSQRFGTQDWKRDLMTRGRSGSVWRIDLNSLTSICIADELAWPYGIAPRPGGAVVVSESWAHRLLRLGPNTRPEPVYSDLPGYPARLVQDDSGGDLWLSIFAPRMQIIEFVLREDEYRNRMIADLDPAHWVAPSLNAPRSFLEPMQGGALKQLGELKPWAPSRSYGLLVRLDESYYPVESLHSRANGTRHGITSCLPDGGRVLVASKGGDAILAVER